MLSSMEAQMGVRLEVIGVKLIVFICARMVKFRSKQQSRGNEVCVVIFGSGLGFVKRSLSRLESLNFKIYRIA